MILPYSASSEISSAYHTYPGSLPSSSNVLRSTPTYALNAQATFDKVVRSWGFVLSKYLHQEEVLFHVYENYLFFSVSYNCTEDSVTSEPYSDEPAAFTGTILWFGDIIEKWESKAQAILNFDTDLTLTQLHFCENILPAGYADYLLQYVIYIINGNKIELGLYNDSVINFPSKNIEGPKCLHNLVPLDSPNIALEFLNQNGVIGKYTYEDLGRISGNISYSLKNCQGTIIPILIPQSPELYFSVIGILRSGRAFCPIAPFDTPKSRIRLICEDINADTVLVTKKTCHLIDGIPINAIIVDTNLEANESYDNVKVSGNDIAYCIFTSGSTGQPKGVLVRHRNATQAILAHSFLPTFERFLNFASITFDVSVLEIFLPWYRRVKLVSADRQLLLSDLAGTMRKLNVDAVELTPTVASTLALEEVPNLKLMMTIGEKLNKSVIKEFGEANILYNTYGPTEAAIQCTAAVNGTRCGFLEGDIGVPLPTTTIIIADPNVQSKVNPVPTGFIGELIIGGAQVAQGYLNRTNLSSTVFLHDPIYGSIYRTGDLAKVLPNGRIIFCGRITDDQVKVRGRRIELGEIEHATEMSAVALVHNSNIIVVVEGVREVALKNCESTLPKFMFPHEIFEIEKIPLLASGKTNRKKIREFIEAKMLHGKELNKVQVYSSDAEKQIAEGIEKILNLSPGSTTSLRSIGLDSILAMRAAAIIKKITGHNVMVADILHADSVSGIADLISSVDSAQPTISEVPNLIDDVLYDDELNEIIAIYPATSLQKSMLIETRRNPKLYVNKVMISVTGSYTQLEIFNAVKKLVDLNDILRTGFAFTEDERFPIVQLVYKDSKYLANVENIDTINMNDLSYPPIAVSITKQNLVEDWLISLKIHHALYDGWSFDMMIEDLATILKGGQLQTRSQFSEAMSVMPDNISEKSLKFWHNYLEGTEIQDIPVLKEPRALLQNDGIAKADRILSLSSDELLQASRKAHISPQTIFQLGWAEILRTLQKIDHTTENTDVLFGTVISRRTHLAGIGAEKALGPMISTLPLKVSFLKNTNLNRTYLLLEKISKDMNLILKHADANLRDVSKFINSEISKPLGSLFVWQQQLSIAEIADIKIVDWIDNLEFDILLEIVTGNQFMARLTYNTDKISTAHANIILEQLDSLSWSIMHNMNDIFKGVISNNVFNEKMLSQINIVPKDLNISKFNILNLIKFNSSKTAVEILNESGAIETISYNQLYEKAIKLAQYLQSKGVAYQEIVGVVLTKSINLYVAIIAIWLIGAVYAPIDVEAPDSRIVSILEGCKAKYCISDKDISGNVSIVFINDVYKADTECNNFAYTHAKSEDTAYIIFTSGSTGIPKGVIVSHNNVANNILELSATYPKPSLKAKILQFCSIGFDVSLFEIIYALFNQMTIFSSSKSILLPKLSKIILENKITHLSLTPTVSSLLESQHMNNVEFIVLAGEPLTLPAIKFWERKPAVFVAAYGPSEMTNICTKYVGMSSDLEINNIGYALSNTSCFILDHQVDHILPIGAIGELAFGGYQVSKGYHNDARATENKFRRLDTFGIVYRTGDWARMLSDGSILYLGRMDNQIKIRGQRVELGEINHTAMSSEVVEDAVTIVQNDNLVTILLVREIAKHNEAVSNAYLAMELNLPSYMVPSQILSLTEFPLTLNGKVDVESLKLTVGNMVNAVTAKDLVIKNGSAEELFIAKAFVAANPRVNLDLLKLDSSLMRYGLDSVSVIKFISQLHKFEISIGISDIMRARTIRNIASCLKSPKLYDVPVRGRALIEQFCQDIEVDVRQSGLSELDIESIIPCSVMQESLLASKKSYVNRFLLKLHKIDSLRLKKSWKRLSESREVLRTCFIEVGVNNLKRSFGQVVLRNEEIHWNEEEYQDFDSTDKLLERFNPAIDIHRPPYQLTLLSGNLGKYLLVSIHHALFDDVALELLLCDAYRLYNEELVVHRLSYVAAFEYIESIDNAEGVFAFNEIFDSFSANPFPKMSIVPSSDSTHLEIPCHVARISKATLASINKSLADHGNTLLIASQIAWARLLSLILGVDDVCFGSVSSGRDVFSGGENVAAPLFYTHPVRVNLEKLSTYSELLEKIDKINQKLSCFPWTPLKKIIHEWSTKTTNHGRKLFDTMIIVQYGTGNENGYDNDLWKLCNERDDIDIPIVLEVRGRQSENALTYCYSFDKSLLDENQAQELLKLYDSLFLDIVHKPSTALHDFSSINIDALSISGNSQKLKGMKYLHDGLDANAIKSPNKIALEFMKKDGQIQKWTYQQLYWISKQLASQLKQIYNATIESSVLLCMDKSPEYYFGMLATLKSGCAFCPIDPHIPTTRLLFMIQDLEANMILVNDDSESLMVSLIQDYDLNIAVLNISKIYNDLSDYIDEDICEVLYVHDEVSTAYRIYTSGSTGQPKAVAVEVRQAVQTILASKDLLSFHKNSKLLQYAAPTFDMSIYDCFIAWSCGITLCSADQHHMISSLVEVINEFGITMLDLTPSVAMTLNKADIPLIETLYCIGEPLPQTLSDEWDGFCINSYGPTETAMCCTITKTIKIRKSSNIGVPFATTSFFILREGSNEVLPKLCVGELCIGGYQVSRGYFNNADLTAEKFVNLEKYDTVVYRTGDRARILNDGTVDFIGRIDDQVKLHGLRIELQEINNIISDALSGSSFFKGVCTAIVGSDIPVLSSFVACLSESNSTESYLINNDNYNELLIQCRSACESVLPSYMIPAEFILISSVPLSTSGKLSQSVLKHIYEEYHLKNHRTLEQDSVNENWSSVQLVIRDTFSLVSGVPADQIRLRSSIYHLGIDSVSATQISSDLRKKNLNCSSLEIVKCLTIEKLSALLTSPGSKKYIQKNLVKEFEISNFSRIIQECGLKESQVSHVFPCTSTQEAILSAFQSSHGKRYFNHIMFEVPNQFNEEELYQSWKTIFEKYDILRTGFVELDGKAGYSYAQVVHKIGEPYWRVSKSDSIEEYLQARLKLLSNNLLSKLYSVSISIDLIIRNSDGQKHLLFTGLHAVFDASTLRLIFDNFARILNHEQILVLDSEYGEILNDILCRSQPSSISKRFWKEMLQDSVVTKMPNLNPFLTQDEGTGHISTISTTSHSELQSLASDLGITIQTAGIAAWSKVLSAYSAEAEVTFGLVLSGKIGIEKSDSTLFPCLTTLPIKVAVKGTNEELLRNISVTSTLALEHQYSARKSLKESGIENVLFDTAFLFQNIGGDTNRFMHWNKIYDYGATEFSCALELEPVDNNRLKISLNYRRSTMPENQAKILVSQFDYWLSNSLEFSADTVIHESLPIPLASVIPSAIDLIPTEINFLHEFVQRKAQTHPQDIALEYVTKLENNYYESKVWTYNQLDEESNRIANFLKLIDIKADDKVATCFEKSPEATFSLIGILKSGASFVAIDSSAPIDRKKYICHDANVKCVLTHGPIISMFGTGFEEIHVIDVLSSEILNSSVCFPILGFTLNPSNLCYCLYTSGSTGNPKGCMITHQNAVQAMLAFQDQFKDTWNLTSKFLQFASFHFDVSILEQFWSWSVGISVVSAPRDLILTDLPALIRKLEITHIDLTPSLAALMVPEEVPSLCRGLFITGGDLLKREVLDAWGDKGVVFNAYGPTEVTIGCTMRRRAPKNIKPSNIGQQFSNVGSAVLYPGTDIPVARGAIGELCVSGSLVGRGYINREDLNAISFSFNDVLKERIYRTGDLVRLLADDSFEFCGRKDTQIKLRGQRLEIGEINETIKLADESVRDVTTLVIQHSSHQKDQLVSMFVINTDDSTEGFMKPTEHIRQLILSITEFCKTKLPLYMVPTYILPIYRTPLNVNNKVDIKTLVDLYQSEPLQSLASYSEVQETNISWSGAELRIRDLISSLLILNPRIESLSRNTTVFELGFDSISAVPLVKKLKKFYPYASLSIVLQNPSISALAKALDFDNPSQKSVISENIPQFLNYYDQAYRELDISLSDIQCIFPCTPLQEGMVSRALRSGDKFTYFQKFYFSLYEEVDSNRLKKSWFKLIAANESLRACFLETESGILQVILAGWSPYWIEVSIAVPQDIEKFLSEFLIHHWENVQLSRPPLVFVLIKSGNTRMLFLGIFHGLYDAQSFEMMQNDVTNYYFDAEVPERPSFISAVYRIRSVPENEARKFWLSQFSSIEESRSFDGGSQNSELIQVVSDATFSNIRQASISLACTPQVLIQSAFVITLGAFYGSAVKYGIVFSGRNTDEEMEQVIGPIFNTVPNIVNLNNFNTLRDLVNHLQNFSASLLPYQHTPLRLIQKWTDSPLNCDMFNALFVYQQKSSSNYESHLWSDVRPGEYMADYPISLDVFIDGAKVCLSLGYLDSYLDKSDAKLFLKQLEENITNLIKFPDMHNPKVMKQKHSEVPNEVSVEEINEKFLEDNSDLIQKVKSCIAKVANIYAAEVQYTKSFFHYGLDSIDAIKLSSMLRNIDIDISVGSIMENPSVLKLVAYILRKPTERLSIQNDLCIEVKGNITFYSCTPIQDGILTETISSKNESYINHDVLELDPDVNIDNLRLAFVDTVAANPIFRALFSPVTSESNLFSRFCFHIDENFALPWENRFVEESTWNESMQHFFQLLSSKIDVFKAPPIYVTHVYSTERKALILSISHALYDGHSIGLFLDDILLRYQGMPVLQRPNFKELLLRIATQSENSNYASFWRELFFGKHFTRFPDCTLQSQTNQQNKVNHLSKVSKNLVENLNTFARKNGITLQSIGQTCWAILLAYYLGVDEVIFGTVLSGRESEKDEEVMFPSMVTIPTLVAVSGSFLTVLGNMQDYMQKVRPHQYTKLTSIFREVSEGKKLFDTLFIYQKLRKSDTSIWRSVSGLSSVEYNVAVEFEYDGVSLKWNMATNNTLISMEATVLLVNQLDRILSNMILQPNMTNFFGSKIDDLLSAISVRPELLADNQTMLQDFFEDSVAKFPNMIALEFFESYNKKHEYTYRELNNLSTSLAKQILKQVRVSNGIIPLLLGRSVEQYISMLAVLKAGYGYVLIDDEASIPQINFILSNCQAKSVLVTETTDHLIADEIKTFIVNAACITSNDQADALSYLPKLTSSQLAYVSYTSDTTVRTKGICITHRNIVDAIKSLQVLVKGSVNDRFLQFASCSVDALQFETHFSWANGMTVVGANKELLLSDLEEFIHKAKITHTYLASSVAANVQKVKCKDIKALILTGESLNQQVLDEWADEQTLHYFYGPAEVTIGCTALLNIKSESKLSNMGDPWPSCSVSHIKWRHLDGLLNYLGLYHRKGL
ncbi:hypothetical protein V1514DRAFT_356642 [Lipomyces japonicus]|uniref:uncharacterized protein n=1 Tax=Lipomyces japonicus TaxID=56871 RepID=UPI0034CF74ED